MLIVRGKGKKERQVIIGEYAQRAIQAWLPVRAELRVKFNLETDALLFSICRRGPLERLHVRSVGRIVKTIAKGNGLPEYHPHILRHACGTHMHDHNRADLYAGLDWPDAGRVPEGASACTKLTAGVLQLSAENQAGKRPGWILVRRISGGHLGA